MKVGRGDESRWRRCEGTEKGEEQNQTTIKCYIIYIVEAVLRD